MKIAALAALPIFAAGILFGKEIINLLFGAQYQESILPFQILISTVLVIFPSALITNASLAADQQKNFIIFSALGVFGNIFLDILLIPPFGIAGSAIATLITQIIANGFIWGKMRKAIKK